MQLKANIYQYNSFFSYNNKLTEKSFKYIRSILFEVVLCKPLLFMVLKSLAVKVKYVGLKSCFLLGNWNDGLEWSVLTSDLYVCMLFMN